MTVVPHDQLAPETLRALVEEFVTRDGAVHGHAPTPVEQQIASVLRQLASGRVVLVYDEESESCTIVAKEAIGAKDVEPESRRVVEDE